MSTLLLSLFVLCGQGDETVVSGPKVGEKVIPFKILAVSGGDAGKEVELAGGKPGPILIVFVHQLSRPAFQLMKPLEIYATRLAPDGLQTHFVWLTADKEKTVEFLDKAKNSLMFQSPIGISLDGQDGPEKLGLNSKAALTILVADKGKVTANFAFTQPNGADAPRVAAAVAKVLGKKPPTPEELK